MTTHPAPAQVPRGVKIGTQSCTEFFPSGSEAKLQGVLGGHEQESVLPAAPGLLPPERHRLRPALDLHRAAASLWCSLFPACRVLAREAWKSPSSSHTHPVLFQLVLSGIRGPPTAGFCASLAGNVCQFILHTSDACCKHKPCSIRKTRG